MPNPTVTNRSINGVVIEGGVFIPVTLTATDAETWPAGAVLGRVTASGAYVRFDPSLSNGAQVPSAVLTQDEVFDAAGSQQARVAVSGQFRMNDLTIEDGTAITAAQAFALRTYGIFAQPIRELTFQDNQA